MNANTLRRNAEHNVVYILIEKRNREYDSKILLASELVSHGVTTVIGYFAAIARDLEFLPPGIVLIKGLNKVQMLIAKQANRFGHIVVATDEEALGIADGKFMMRVVDQEAHSEVDLVFCQGQEQADALVSHADFLQNQLRITGNTRLDLLREPFKRSINRDSEEIRRKFGNFILVNTNSANFNNKLWPNLEEYRKILGRIGWLDNENPNDVALFEEVLEHDRNNIKSITSFVRLALGSNPNTNIVLRPHPSEGIELWKSLETEILNLRVITGTEAVAWIAAAQFLVHTGCTTGLEAVILDTPNLSLVDQPKDITCHEFFLSNAVNPQAGTPEQALDIVQTTLANPKKIRNFDQFSRVEKLKPHIEFDLNEFSFQKIARALLEFLPEGTEPGEIILSAGSHRYLRRNTSQTTFHEGYMSIKELQSKLSFVQTQMGHKPSIAVQDIEWGVYVLSPKTRQTIRPVLAR